MASISKRGKTWQYAISNYVEGKSRPIRKSGFKTKKEAEIAAAEMELFLKGGGQIDKNKTPFSDYFESWYTIYKTGKVDANTLKHYVYTFNLIKKHFKDTPINDIDRRQYQEFINDIGSTRSKHYVSKVHTQIKACIADAIEDKLLTNDFTRKTKVSGQAQKKKRNEMYFNYQEYKTFLNAVTSRLQDDDAYYAILVALATGMRFSEIIGLTVSDFDFINNKVNINKTWNYFTGRDFGFAGLKNDSSERKIKVDDMTMQHMKEYIERMTPNEYDLLFFKASSKHKCINNTQINRIIRELSKELKIKAINFHGLRHTHASTLLYQKASIYYVSERLGHKDINTTLREYTHVMKELRENDERTTVDIMKDLYKNDV